DGELDVDCNVAGAVAIYGVNSLLGAAGVEPDSIQSHIASVDVHDRLFFGIDHDHDAVRAVLIIRGQLQHTAVAVEFVRALDNTDPRWIRLSRRATRQFSRNKQD